MLPCGHTLCAPCLNSIRNIDALWESSQNRSSYRLHCPQCRYVTEIPASVSNLSTYFQTNMSLKRLADQQRGLRTSRPVPICVPSSATSNKLSDVLPLTSSNCEDHGELLEFGCENPACNHALLCGRCLEEGIHRSASTTSCHCGVRLGVIARWTIWRSAFGPFCTATFKTTQWARILFAHCRRAANAQHIRRAPAPSLWHRSPAAARPSCPRSYRVSCARCE